MNILSATDLESRYDLKKGETLFNLARKLMQALKYLK